MNLDGVDLTTEVVRTERLVLRPYRPADVDQYTQLHIVGDLVGLLDACGIDRAVVVGHDWGGPVAWHSALLRPDRFVGIAALSTHWGGVTPRFSPEDFKTRSLFGVGTDWPITYEDLDPAYQAAEELMGVAGEQGPPELDPRGKPFPLPVIPLSYNLERLQAWASRAGIPTWSQPSAKLTVARADRAACCRNDTCTPICPVGAKYSPDMTWRALRASGRVELHPRTLVRRLRLASRTDRIEAAEAVQRDRAAQPVEYRATTFVLAAGYVWSSWLLLVSANARFGNGLANRSGLVGKYITGHRNVQAFIALPMKLYPGINEQHSLVTKHFMRKPLVDRYVRHDLRIWESTVGSCSS